MADERDLGSRGAIRASSNLAFPTWDEISGRGSVVERLLAKEKVVGSNPIARSSSIVSESARLSPYSSESLVA